ncbi:maltose alpha-D-glucosyltransferase [Rhodospirillaceae bacterium SYSU D60014]|uniref:maltose alpha-D-glucosyltransferase n=1 Tax=Virgifigura deserti TaxID=2268457 RepID=UPI000E666609
MLSDDPLWYKDAIIYQTHVKSFFDSNNDGVGDFAGLTAKLDYVRDLGVTAIWLLPFYVSPLRDDGYDIADYRAVHPAYGTLSDFRKFVREAHRRDLRVITELVINHTSDQHRWFQRSRTAKPGSRWRDYYVWSDSDQKYLGTRIIFTDTETSNWAWDPVAKAYYWHRFFSHQPDLNFDNPRVVKEVIDAMYYWLDMGVDGLRLDAIPYLVERDGTNNENLAETHKVIKTLRAALDARYENRMLLAEANQWPEDVRPYFGNGDECHMAFHFPVMPRLYMAVAQEDRHPITDIMRQTPDIPDSCQWAIFLRNHDELTLEMVTDRERDYLWRFYAADARARINLGIRRRLAPLLENDRRKIELLNSLLLSMPGTPIIYYGDEIGMGDNVYLGDRDGVRTPMQWAPDRNSGFSKADPQGLYLPPIMDPVYGFQSVNVEAQSRSSSSLLNWMKRIIAVRKMQPAFGRGALKFLYPGNRKIVAYLREYEDNSILCVANLSRSPQPVELDLSAYKGRAPIELIGRSPFPTIGELPYFVTLPAYGFYWFLLAQEAEAPSWHEPYVQPLPELLTLVMPHGWQSLLSDRARDVLQTQSLPEFLPNQRWFAAKDVGIDAVELVETAEVARSDWVSLFAVCQVALRNGATQDYFLPFAIAWENAAEDPLVSLLPYSLGRVRKGPRRGVLHDAVADPTFARATVESMHQGRAVPTAHGGRIEFAATSAFPSTDGIEEWEISRLGKEQSNTSLMVGDGMVLKAYRRLQPGIHPELEIGRYLTDVAHYRNTPPLLGSVELFDERGQPTVLATLQGFVRNQGDGWSYTLDYLSRFLDTAQLVPEEELQPTPQETVPGVPAAAESLDPNLQLFHMLGIRTAELHRAFALDTDDPAFRPAPVTAADLSGWKRKIRKQAQDAITAIRKVRRRLPEAAAEDAATLLDHRKALLDRIGELVPARLDAVKTRYHGDYHLGQVIVVKDDFYILDFEGEPARSLADRRAKHSPLRDVAGMLRSFNYAAWSALFDRAALEPRALETLQPWTDLWEERVSNSFLTGYRETIGDCPSYPTDADQARNLIDLFSLEKALYEICYEAANRPAWLGIPLRGVTRLLKTED